MTVLAKNYRFGQQCLQNILGTTIIVVPIDSICLYVIFSPPLIILNCEISALATNVVHHVRFYRFLQVVRQQIQSNINIIILP